jgi:hypothetical protein
MKLSQRRDPVAQVVEHEGRHYQVHARIFEKRQRLSQIVLMQFASDRAAADAATPGPWVSAMVRAGV